MSAKKLHTNQIVQNIKLKQQIESTINDFKNPDLFKTGINLFKTPGYNTYRQSRLDNPTFDGFLQ